MKERRWWTLDERRVHESLWHVVKQIRQNQGDRIRDDAHYARLYSNKEFQAHSLALYGSAEPIVNKRRLKMNVIKACVDTAAAMIAKNKPRPLFMTERGKFEQEKRAENLTQYLDGFFDAENVYEKGVKAFFRGGVYGTGALKVSRDEKKLHIEAVLPSELEVDELDGLYGEPRSLYQLKYIHRDILAQQFPSSEAQEIIRAASSGTELNSQSESARDMVLVIEGWHLRSGEASDGRHAIVTDTGTLFAEEWEKDYFPFAFFRWNERLAGFFGGGIPEEIEGIQIEINRLLMNVSDAHNLVVVPRVLVPEATHIKAITNETGSYVRYRGEKPEWITPQGLPPEIYNHIDRLWNKGFEQIGISQLSATSRKPSGLDSGAALREYNDIESERFVLVGQRYEAMFLDLAKIIVDYSKDLYQSGNKSLSVFVKQKDFLKQIKWKDVDLEADKYTMRVFPTSFLPTTPAAKMQSVQELIKGGMIQQDDAMELLDFPDVKAFTSLSTASTDYIKNQLEKMLEDGEPQVPNVIMDLEKARRMTVSKIQEAEISGYPEERIDLLYGYLNWIDRFLAEAVPPAPPAAPPMPQGQPPAPGPEMMNPAAPM